MEVKFASKDAWLVISGNIFEVKSDFKWLLTLTTVIDSTSMVVNSTLASAEQDAMGFQDAVFLTKVAVL